MSKKLKKADINKNASFQVSHSINRIKENERKYTIILVLFFMILFGVIGYGTLTVNKKIQLDYLKSISYGSSELTSTSAIFTLTTDDVLSNELGLEKERHNVNITNDSSYMIKYKILYVIDNDITKKCGCENKKVDSSLIHYSTDLKTVSTFVNSNSLVVYEGEILASESKIVEISMWLDESLDKTVDYHIHGHFVVEKES